MLVRLPFSLPVPLHPFPLPVLETGLGFSFDFDFALGFGAFVLGGFGRVRLFRVVLIVVDAVVVVVVLVVLLRLHGIGVSSDFARVRRLASLAAVSVRHTSFISSHRTPRLELRRGRARCVGAGARVCVRFGAMAVHGDRCTICEQV